MKKLLLIALLIVGCDNSTQSQDCAGVAGGTAVEDACGVCDTDTTNDCVPDCIAGDGTDGFKLWDGCYSIAETDTLNLINMAVDSDLPAEIAQFSNLVFLSIVGVGVYTVDRDSTYVPESFGYLNKLSHLSIKGFGVISLPESICNIIPNLSYFDISHNYICDELPSCLTPDSIGLQYCP